MSTENETHAAVIAKMRESDNEATCPWWAGGGDCELCPMGGSGNNCPFDKFAYRFEAAHKREIEKLNSVIQATVSRSDAEQDRQRREREKLRKMLAQMAQTATAARTCRSDEEILRTVYLEDIAKLCETALALFSNSPENENSGGDNFTAGKQELNENSKSAQIEFSNVGKLREVCMQMLELLMPEGYENCDVSIELDEDQVLKWRNRFRNALATPPRNCDVGTAGEQTRRFAGYCARHRHTDLPKCAGCPLENLPSGTGCEEAWAQMPYTESEVSHGNA